MFLATKVFPCEPYRFENVTVALDNSLRRLQTDHVDLYQLHGPQDWVVGFPDAAAPIEEIGAALARLVESGRVRHVGVCNLPLATIEALAAHVERLSTQNLYSLYDRGGNDPIHLPVSAEILHGPADARRRALPRLQPRSPAASSAPISTRRGRSRRTTERHFLPRFQPDVYPHWARLSNRLEAWAADHGHSLPQLAVAWTLATGEVTSTLIGAKTAAQVEAIAGAERWELTAGDLAEIDDLCATLGARGGQPRLVDRVGPLPTRGGSVRMRDRRHTAATTTQLEDPMTTIDERPVLVCRIECPPHMAEG